jgi:hypothetical protein
MLGRMVHGTAQMDLSRGKLGTLSYFRTFVDYVQNAAMIISNSCTDGLLTFFAYCYRVSLLVLRIFVFSSLMKRRNSMPSIRPTKA